MPDYKEMYIALFQSMTRAITILQEAQKQTEAMYLDAEAVNVTLLRPGKQNPPKPAEKGK
ncbi:MAG: hypothetical protein VB099_11290 [Candidatus Limiplasma sp.]|nr:hypothetical protein [Candidatus Limiplasma sp.]